MTLLQILRVAFLACLGIHLLVPNEPCRLVAGVSAVVLAVFVLTGAF